VYEIGTKGPNSVGIYPYPADLTYRTRMMAKVKKEGFLNITIYVICFSLFSSKRGWVSDRSQHRFHSSWYIMTELPWWEFELLFLIHLGLANWINSLCMFNQYCFRKLIVRIFILFKQLYNFHLIYLTYMCLLYSIKWRYLLFSNNWALSNYWTIYYNDYTHILQFVSYMPKHINHKILPFYKAHKRNVMTA
jgi:hypothetical protein